MSDTRITYDDYRTEHPTPFNARREIPRALFIAVAMGAVLLAVALALVSGHVNRCEPVDISSTTTVSDAEVWDLIDQGYTGSATDGVEALYAPGCNR